MSYILFYSTYCKYSKKFVDILEQCGEAAFFVKICVDIDPETLSRPVILNKYRVTEVPTIIVENKKLAGYAAFKWLQVKIENTEEPMTQTQQTQESGIEPFFTGNVENFTDNCVKLGGDTAPGERIVTPNTSDNVKKTNNFILKDDELTLQAMNTTKNNNSPLSAAITTGKDKLKSKQFDNEYNKLLQERDQTMPKPVQRF